MWFRDYCNLCDRAWNDPACNCGEIQNKLMLKNIEERARKLAADPNYKEPGFDIKKLDEYIAAKLAEIKDK
jgi:hypothetical protein